MKNKGFMLVETLIASTIILGALVFLFVQFSSIKRAYETSFKHNTIQGLYSAKELSNCLESHSFRFQTDISNSTNGYIKLSKDLLYNSSDAGSSNLLCSNVYKNIGVSQLLYVGNNISYLQNSLKGTNYNKDIFNEGFKKFVLELDPIEYLKQGRLIIEYKNNTYAVIATNFKI